jgi:predicted dehydrogenase
MWTLSELRWATRGVPERIEAIDPSEGVDLGYRAESAHFIDRIREGAAPDVTVSDGLAALQVSLTLVSSAAEGGRTLELAGSRG